MKTRISVLFVFWLCSAPLVGLSQGMNNTAEIVHQGDSRGIYGVLNRAVISKKMGYQGPRGFNKHYRDKKREYQGFLDNYIRTVKDATGAEGISISVISDDDLLFLKGYGYADRANGVRVNPLTLFRVGSISKLFTGIAIMQLVEEGLLDLDAPLDTYIPDFAYLSNYSEKNPITVRTLMTHQSGLVGYIGKEMDSDVYPPEHFSKLVDRLADEYLAYPPNYISTYSNSGVTLLGLVVENISGVEFKEYVKDEILKPMWMLMSNFVFRDYMAPFMAASYGFDDSETPHIFIRAVPAGSLISNSLELTLFMKTILNDGKLFGKQVLKKQTLNRMFTQQNADVELDFPNNYGDKWGLSWFLGSPRIAYAGKVVGHDGWIPDYSSQMHILPEHGFAVMIMINSYAGADAIFDIADVAIIKALEIFKGISEPEPQPVPSTVPLTTAHVEQTSGTYVTNQFGLITVYPHQNKLWMSSFLLGTMECVFHEDDFFSLQIDGQPVPGFEPIRMIVKYGEQERFIGLEYRDTNGTIYRTPFGAEYAMSNGIPQEWLERMGQYTVVNPSSIMFIGDNVDIIISPKGVLHITFNNGYSVNVLDPINSEEALVAGRGRNLNQTIRVVYDQNEEYLQYLGYLFQKQPIPMKRETKRTTKGIDTRKMGEKIARDIKRKYYHR